MNAFGIVRIGLGLLFALGAIWLVITYNLTAAYVADGEIPAALALRANSAMANSAAAEDALAHEDSEEAAARARKSLAAHPRDVASHRTLALIDMGEGDLSSGAELFIRAGSLGWRDDIVQLWLAQQALLQSNYDTAAQRLDALLRRERRQQEVLPAMHQLAVLPDARPSIVARLVEEPKWRRAFFHQTQFLEPATLAGHSELIADLSQTARPATRGEIVPFVKFLLSNGHLDLALSQWSASLASEGKQAYVGGIYDADFDDVRGTANGPAFPFEWTLTDRGHALARVEASPAEISDRALYAETSDRRNRQIARQLLTLPPGSYQIDYEATFAQPGSRDRFAWQLKCDGGQRLRLGRPQSRTIGSKVRVVQDVEIPPDCPLQELSLVAEGAVGAAVKAAWFHYIRIREA